MRTAADLLTTTNDYALTSTANSESLDEFGQTYPVRVRILDVAGEVWHGIEIATPDESKPHVGKEGLAELVDDPDAGPDYEAVRITLDDGAVLWGWECWWEPSP